MDIPTFKQHVGRLCRHTGKRLTKEQSHSLYDQIKEIGDSAIAAIVDEMLRDMPMTPSKFPTAGQLLAAWYAYRRAHREYRQADHEDCETCGGHGVGREWFIDDNGVKTTKLVFCGDCQNWRRQFGHGAIRSVSPDGVMIDTTDMHAPGIEALVPFRRSPEWPGRGMS